MDVDLRSPSTAYAVEEGIIYIYPISVASQDGHYLEFRLVIDEDATISYISSNGNPPALFTGFSSTPQPQTNPYLNLTRERFNSAIAKLGTYLCGLHIPIPDIPLVSPSSEFNQAIPTQLHDHLIIVTPPPFSTFPRLYPKASVSCPRVWRDYSFTWFTVINLRLSGVPEVRVPFYPQHRLGTKRAKLGDLIFVNKIAYCLTEDIGELPHTEEYAEGLIAMEAHTHDHTFVLLIVPRRYLVPPTLFAEVIEGPTFADPEEENEEDRVEKEEGEELED
jgi:hypothetical protein